MTQYGFFFDNSRCTGCRTCEIACKDYHNLDTTEAYRKVYDYEGGELVANAQGGLDSSVFMYHVSTTCNHCEVPKCFAACPSGAIEKDDETGLVVITEACTGAGACVDACPYGVPIMSKATGKAIKCDGCKDRVAEGKLPICVEACPLRALEFGPIDELRAAHPDAVDAIAPLPDPAITKPNVIIKPSPAAKKVGDTTGYVSNEKEVTGVEGMSVGNRNPVK